MIEQTTYLRGDVGAFLGFLNGLGGPELSELPIAEARAACLAMVPIAEADPLPLAVIAAIRAMLLRATA